MEGPGPGVYMSRIAYAGRAKSTHDLASPHRPPATVGWVLLPTDRWSSTRPAPHVNVEASGVLSSSESRTPRAITLVAVAVAAPPSRNLPRARELQSDTQSWNCEHDFRVLV